MKSIEKKVDDLTNPHKKRSRRSIGISKKMAIGIFAIMIAAALIASGALLSYHGKVTTTIDVQQAVTLDGNSFSGSYASITVSDTITSSVGGCCELGNLHHLDYNSNGCGDITVNVVETISPNDGGMSTTWLGTVLDAGASSNGATMTAYVYDDSDCNAEVTTASELTTELAGTASVICLKDGTYTGTFSIGRAVTLKGESETGVIIDGNGAGNVFTIAASGTVTIQGMTIQNGVYGIRSTSGNVNVKHCTFVHNGWDGTGVDSTPTQGEMATLWASSATSNGGAIRIQDSASSEVAYVTAYENARGIRIQDTDLGDIHDCVSHDNLESGIYLSSSSYTSAHGCTNTVVENCDSYNNMNNGLLSIGGKNNDFHGNNVYDNWNTGMMLWDAGEIDVYGNNFDNNCLYDFNGIGNQGDDEGGIWATSNGIYTGSTYVCKIHHNTISDTQVGGLTEKVGIHIDGNMASNGIEIKNNDFSDHDIDVWVENEADTTVLHYNNFDSDNIDVKNDDTQQLDATLNWWGQDGIVIVGDVDTSYYGYSVPSTIAMSPGDTVYFKIQYCLDPMAVGTYSVTTRFQ